MTLLVCACTPKVIVTVTNNAGFGRAHELVEVPVGQLAKIVLAEGETYVVNNAAGEVVPSQLTHDGLLVFQSGLGAGETAKFTIGAGAPQEFATKTSGWFSPERMDDFVWENDRVAFRTYGNALIAKDGPSNGIDALYKRSEDMVIGRWYKDFFEKGLSYHQDNGTGLDDYTVGRSTGAGAMAPYADGKLWLNRNFTGHEVLDNGPLRTTFRLTYPALEVDGKTYSDSRTISIDAGSQMSKIVQEYNFTEPMPVAAGIARRYTKDPSDPVTVGEDYFIYSEPTTRASSGVKLAIVMPGMEGTAVDEYEIPKTEKNGRKYMHTLALATYQPGTPVTYYIGFGWEKWGYPDLESFKVYVENFVMGLETPLVVGVE